MKKAKQEKLSVVDFNKKYFNNPAACEAFFFPAKYPNGFYCEKCECQHQEYLFAGTNFRIIN